MGTFSAPRESMHKTGHPRCQRRAGDCAGASAQTHCVKTPAPGKRGAGSTPGQLQLGGLARRCVRSRTRAGRCSARSGPRAVLVCAICNSALT
jgi:hypothetical protein